MIQPGSTPVKVAAARSIGEEFHKDIVVILAYEHRNRRCDATTWGREPHDKEDAVRISKSCLAALGVDLSTATNHEDYRFTHQGQQAKIVDQLVRAAKAADHAIASIMATRDGSTNDLLQSVRDALQEAVDNA